MAIVAAIGSKRPEFANHTVTNHLPDEHLVMPRIKLHSASANRSVNFDQSPTQGSFSSHLQLYGRLTEEIPESDRGTGALIDKRTLELSEISGLLDVIKKDCHSFLGVRSLERSLTRPPVSPEVVQARQDAVRELAQNNEARVFIDRLLTHAAADIQTLKEFFDGPPRASQFSQISGALDRLGDLVKDPPKFASPLLSTAVAVLAKFSANEAKQLFVQPVCSVSKKVVVASEAPMLSRILNRYIPGPVGPRILAGAVIGAGLIVLGSQNPALELCTTIGAGIVQLMLCACAFKTANDKRDFLAPIGRRLWSDPDFGEAWTAVGLIDELRTLACLKDRYQDGGTFPDIMSSPTHVLNVSRGHNPLLALSKGLSVANDFSLRSGGVLAVTGPNSGGKSTFARTAQQLQCLGQIGAPLPVASCELSPVDELEYQAQEFNDLSDPEGRFGTELKETKNLFLRATLASFVIFDELAQGTTHEESQEIASYIIKGLSRLGATGILITHDHELVEKLDKERFVTPLQVELRKDTPTYRVVPGVAKTSHALRVARKIGFGPEDVERIVLERGREA